MLDPEVRAHLRRQAAAGVLPVHKQTIEEARLRPRALASLLGAGPDIAHVDDLVIDAGDHALPVRCYTASDSPIGTLVWFHGGGWVMGAVADFDAACKAMAVNSGARIVSVEYRLAPEHVFPAAVEDAWTALCWAGDRFGQEVPLLVGGDSAGGNLAAVCAQRARHSGGPALRLQVLVYPVLAADFSTSSYQRFAAGFSLERADMEFYWDHYLPDRGRRADPEASPLLTDDLSEVAPAYILLAGCDVLRSEGEAYATRLRAAGVPVELVVKAGQIHGFFSLVGYFSAAGRASAALGAAIKAGCPAGRRAGEGRHYPRDVPAPCGGQRALPALGGAGRSQLAAAIWRRALRIYLSH